MSLKAWVWFQDPHNAQSEPLPQAALCPLHVCHGTYTLILPHGCHVHTHSHSSNEHLEIRKIKLNKAKYTLTKGKSWLRQCSCTPQVWLLPWAGRPLENKLKGGREEPVSAPFQTAVTKGSSLGNLGLFWLLVLRGYSPWWKAQQQAAADVLCEGGHAAASIETMGDVGVQFLLSVWFRQGTQVIGWRCPVRVGLPPQLTFSGNILTNTARGLSPGWCQIPSSWQDQLSNNAYEYTRNENSAEHRNMKWLCTRLKNLTPQIATWTLHLRLVYKASAIGVLTWNNIDSHMLTNVIGWIMVPLQFFLFSLWGGTWDWT